MTRMGLAFIVAAVPLSAGAGLFSLISDMFAPKVAAQITLSRDLNSQTVPLLRGAVHSDPNPSKGGGDITIIENSALLPDAGPSGTLADIEHHRPESDQISIYVVREGDSLSQIAEMFNVTTNTIIWANDLDRKGAISPGQTLVILPVSGIRHTVKSGETIQSIAKKYGGDTEEIVQYNSISESTKLAVGDVVIVPDGEIAVAVVPKTAARSSSASASSRPSVAGYFIRPIDGGVRTQGLHGYNAVDLGAHEGSPIYAAAPGTVLISRASGWNGGYGNYVVIKHGNGTQTLYAHMSSNAAATGQFVSQGEIIGYVGSTGKSTGPHLHFEVRGAANPF